MRFSARAFLIWYASKHNNPTPEEVARWQFARCEEAVGELREEATRAHHAQKDAEKRLKSAMSNIDHLLEKIAILERTCDKAVAKMHFMETAIKKKPLPPDEDKLFRSLCVYAEHLVSLHDRYDDGNAKRFGPAVETARRHLEKCKR